MPHIKQGGITVDAAHELAVPVTAHAAAVRNERLAARMKPDHTAVHQPYHDHTHDGHPALDGLKQTNTTADVFPHPTNPRKHKF